MKHAQHLALVACLLMVTAAAAAPQTVALTPPEEVGLSAERLQRIDDKLTEYVDRGLIAGAVVGVARRGKVVRLDAVGMADIAQHRQMRTDVIFRIASMTKPIVTVAALTLYEEGRLGLDDPVSKYVPEFKRLKVYSSMTKEGLAAKREMTIRDLLTHTSGLTYGLFGETPVDSAYRAANLTAGTLRDLVRKLSELPLLHQPGERWEYSWSTDVLGYVIETVSHQPLDEFLAQRVLLPLGMRSTGFYVAPDQRSRLAAMYNLSSSGHLEPLADPRDSRPVFLSGGGGLVSTAADYLRFSQMLLNKGSLDGIHLLNASTVDLMTRNHIAAAALPLHSSLKELDDYVQGYGFGFGVRVLLDRGRLGTGSNGAFGWSGARNTFVWVDPTEELIGVVMIQLSPFRRFPIDRDVERLLYESILR